MTPEQICLAFLKAVEKAKQKDNRIMGHAMCNSKMYSLSFGEINWHYLECNRLEVGYGRRKEGAGFDMLYHESVSTPESLSQEETATRLLSMIKELEVYGIKLEEV